MRSYGLSLVVALIGCERADAIPETPSIAHPIAPDVDAMRSSTAMHVPPPPAAARILASAMPSSPVMRWFLALTPQERHGVRAICRERQKDPCWRLLPLKHPDGPVPDELAFLADEQRDGVTPFCARVFPPHRGCNTPLVVAFGGESIEFTPATRELFAFAGEPVASDWPTAATPWIALDRDGDGAITSGAELFGDGTVLPDGSTARDGFAALAALDTNDDGVIDRRDPAFAQLVLWADRDGNRTSAPAELQPLADVVVAIPLATTAVTRCNERGDCEGGRGAVQWRDAAGDHTGAVVDVYLPTARTRR